MASSKFGEYSPALITELTRQLLTRAEGDMTLRASSDEKYREKVARGLASWYLRDQYLKQVEEYAVQLEVSDDRPMERLTQMGIFSATELADLLREEVPKIESWLERTPGGRAMPEERSEATTADLGTNLSGGASLPRGEVPDSETEEDMPMPSKWWTMPQYAVVV